MKYKVVSIAVEYNFKSDEGFDKCIDSSDFDESIQEWIRIGWRLSGGKSSFNAGSELYFSQALTWKYDKI